MQPLARFTASLGAETSGSDRTDAKNDFQIPVAREGSSYEAALITKAKSVVYSSAISPSHPSLVLAKSKIPHVYHRSDLLAKFSQYFRTVSIAGSHGKTTTSALICHCLKALNQDPSWVIGAPLSDGQSSWNRGESDLLIIEADESDGTFLRYKNFISVINNIEPDHMDFYRTFDRLEAAFCDFALHTSTDGAVVYNGDSMAVGNAIKGYLGQKISFGLNSDCHIRILESTARGLNTLARYSVDGDILPILIPLPGKHNLLNAAAAMGVGIGLGLDPHQLAQKIQSFGGVQRRMQRYSCSRQLIVFDDYAHNPGKIASCLRGLAEAYPERRIIAVFQPHRYSRVSTLYNEFIKAFSGLNINVIVLPVYSAGETLVQGFEPARIAADIRISSGVKTFFAATLKDASELIKSMVNPSQDVVITIGAGDVWQVAEDLSKSF